MNTLVLASLLLTVSTAIATSGLEVSTRAVHTPLSSTGPSSGARGSGLRHSTDEDEEYDQEEDLSEGSLGDDADLPEVQRSTKPGETRKSRRKGKGKRKQRGKGVADHAQHQENHPKPEDPCFTTHQDFCIQGQCQYMEDLGEPTCVCTKGYEGVRCATRMLKVQQGQKKPETGSADGVRTVLVVVAVVLSLISCSAILLMLCAHYRTHKNFLAAYLGTGTEKERLQANSV